LSLSGGRQRRPSLELRDMGPSGGRLRRPSLELRGRPPRSAARGSPRGGGGGAGAGTGTGSSSSSSSGGGSGGSNGGGGGGGGGSSPHVGATLAAASPPTFSSHGGGVGPDDGFGLGGRTTGHGIFPDSSSGDSGSAASYGAPNPEVEAAGLTWLSPQVSLQTSAFFLLLLMTRFLPTHTSYPFPSSLLSSTCGSGRRD
jgi:hypothetical protein